MPNTDGCYLLMANLDSSVLDEVRGERAGRRDQCRGQQHQARDDDAGSAAAQYNPATVSTARPDLACAP